MAGRDWGLSGGVIGAGVVASVKPAESLWAMTCTLDIRALSAQAAACVTALIVGSCCLVGESKLGVTQTLF